MKAEKKEITILIVKDNKELDILERALIHYASAGLFSTEEGEIINDIINLLAEL